MSNTIIQLEEWLAALLLGAAMFVGWGIGWWAGHRRAPLTEDSTDSKFEDAALALLGLLLAFTFSMSLSKYEQRRVMVITDSNAIGDFYTCATILKEPIQGQLQTVVREYVELRLDLAAHPPDHTGFDAALLKMQRMHGQMTGLVAQAISDGTPIATPLTNTLNGLTSSHAARLAAVRDRVPMSIMLLLFLSAVLATTLTAYRQSVSRKSDAAGSIGFTLLVALVVYAILDLNQPARGMIVSSQEPLRRLLSSMK